MINDPEKINELINNINKLDDETIKEVEKEDIEEDITKINNLSPVEWAIRELRESYELKHREWASNCLDIIKEELDNSIPISVIQNTLDDTNKSIEEFTTNVVTTKEEIEQEYWKSELNKAIAKKNVLKEILEKGNK